MAQTPKQAVATKYNYRLRQLKGMESTLSHYIYDSREVNTPYLDPIFQREQAIIKQLRELSILYQLHRDEVISTIDKKGK